MKKKNSLNRKLITFAIFLVAILLVVGFVCYRVTLNPNVSVPSGEHRYILVDRDDKFEDVVEKLKASGCIKDMTSFKLMAKHNDYPKNIKPGRYELTDGMGNYMLVHNLLNARQAPLRFTFNNIRTKEQLAQRLSSQLMMDSVEVMEMLNDASFLSQFGLIPETSTVFFIPDTYEVYWTISPKDLFKKMKENYDKFWTEDRKLQLNDCGLSQVEVSILASIVEEETNKKDEQPRVAGLYLNRLHQGMPLQADPTVKFAIGDFSLKRIYGGHLEIDSPYNTYKNVGLPIGPIRIPSANGIKAVLNYTGHNYLYMCAKEDFSGYHNFAATYEDHLKNAAKYRKALDERGVK